MDIDRIQRQSIHQYIFTIPLIYFIYIFVCIQQQQQPVQPSGAPTPTPQPQLGPPAGTPTPPASGPMMGYGGQYGMYGAPGVYPGYAPYPYPGGNVPPTQPDQHHQ